MKEQLERDGVAMLGGLTPEQLLEISTHLVNKPVFLGGHVKRCALDGSITTKDLWLEHRPRRVYRHSLGCYDFDAIVTCPHLILKALESAELAEGYLEQEPVVYSANIFWSFPGGPVMPEVQQWHRDVDDKKFLVVYFYLTAVSIEEAHFYEVGSHRRGNTERTAVITGKAGQMFIEDGYGLHKGMHPQHRPRLAAWVRFGVSDPPESYKIDELYPVFAPSVWEKMNEKQRRMTRLIVRNV
jgi:hypothetical protein